MNSKITYHQQISYCGKPRCRKCREGIGHGPYWYAYQTVNGRTTRTYIGKHLPPGVQATLETAPEIIVEPSLSADLPAELDSVSIRISTLGQFRLERRSGRDAAWQTVTDSAWQQPRVRLLLAYLICAPGRKVNREQALEDLWPDSAVSVATNNLHRAVHHLRQVLGHQRATNLQELLLRSEGDWLMLADQSHIWIDADAFEALLAQVDALGIKIEAGAGAAQLAQCERLLKQAAALYSNDFLPEERYAEWVIARRQALRRNWVRLLLELADVYIAQGASAGAIDVLDRLLAKDPANEAAVQRLIVVLARLKRRGEALRAYHRLADVLYSEFRSVPSEETRMLYETVRQGGTITGEAITANPALDPVASVQPGAPPQPVPAGPATEVNGAAAVAPAQIGRSHQSQLVGRESELGTLRSLLIDAEQHARLQLVGQRRLSGIPLDTQRRPQCAVLMGEAGIGKTRLAEELSREAQRRGWTVAWGRIYSQEGGIPYRLWTDVLRRILDTGSGLAPALRLPALTTIAQETLQPLMALLPELATVLQPALQQQTARRQAMSVQGGGEGERDQVRLWEAVHELLIAASESAPLLIVLDDIQWADVSSFELLGYLARHLYGYPVLLLGTCRETELPGYPLHPLRSLIAHMQREHSVMTLNIEPLTSEQIAQLVSHLPESMVQRIQEQAAGNPFFAEELARTAPPALPRTIADALDHRLSRLSASCLQLLGTAAVLGGSFEFPIIYAMEAGGATGDEDTVLNLLEEGLQAGVLTEEGVGTRITYRFWHPLVVSHLYERLSAARRLRLHQRAADALLTMYQERVEEVAATITYHLIKGGAEPQRIARFAELAGDHAYALSAYAEAGRHYRLALENARTQSAPASTEEMPHLIFLLERLAECTVILGDFVEARSLYMRALELHRARCEARPATSQAVARYEAQIQALLWGEIGWTWRYTGDSERARECCRHGEQVLRDAGVVAGPAWARLLHQEGSLYWQEGRYEEARRAAQEALSLFEQQQKLPTGPLSAATDSPARTTRIQRTLEGDPADLGLTHRLLGALANAEGRRTEALEHLKTALAIFEQYDHKRRIAHVSSDLGHVYLKKARYELAQSSLRRALNLAERLGDTPLTALVFYNLAELAAADGDLDESEGWYRRALSLAERINDREYVSMWNVGLAGVLQEEEKLDEAATCIIRALGIGRAMRNDPCIGAALVALGTMRIIQARAVQILPRARERLLRLARRDVERALALSGLEAETRTRGRLALAQIALLSGETEKARAEIERVIEEARRYELVSLETQAQQLLNVSS
jgi:DNA-binding SARP family transcriptional activator/predicted ATPase